MTELNTLKDMTLYITNYTTYQEDKIKHQLRQEAIKWIKLWKHQQFSIKDAEIYMMKQSKINWVKHFFNITDEDLK